MNVSEWMVAQVESGLAELEASDRVVAEKLESRRVRGPRTGGSVVFSIRRDPDEVQALERRAAVQGIGPRGLARSLIRRGLNHRDTAAVSSAVTRVEAAVAELRALVP
jgi:hypothetical protein